MDLASYITVGIALATISTTGGLALLSRMHDRQQQARPVLLAPAEAYSRAVLAALAALRHVTPPKPDDELHRNHRLLEDPEELDRRMAACESAVDEVRSARAVVRLVFHPGSRAADCSRLALADLRLALEAAQTWYATRAASAPPATPTDQLAAVRARYKEHRTKVYEAMDDFSADVAERLARPSWNPRRIPGARAADWRSSGS